MFTCTHLWARDPWSAQDGSTSNEKCTPVWQCTNLIIILSFVTVITLSILIIISLIILSIITLAILNSTHSFHRGQRARAVTHSHLYMGCQRVGGLDDTYLCLILSFFVFVFIFLFVTYFQLYTVVKRYNTPVWCASVHLYLKSVAKWKFIRLELFLRYDQWQMQQGRHRC